MWSRENRIRYDRLRYLSDPTDAEWAHVEPLILPARVGGNRRLVDMREVGREPLANIHELNDFFSGVTA